MGKAKRLRAARAEQTDDLLFRLTRVLGARFDGRPECIEAAALMVATAEHLGLTLRPRAVGIAVAQGDKTLVMGLRAAEALVELGGHDITDQPELTSGWNGAAHVIVTCDSRQLLLDPTITQVRVAAIEVPPLCMRVRDTDPASGQWEAIDSNFRVLYVLAEEDDTWRAEFEHELALARRFEAGHLASLLREGCDVDDIGWERRPAA